MCYNVIKRGVIMAKKKKRETFSLDEELLIDLGKLSERTFISKAKLVSIAIADLLTKYKVGEQG